MNMLNLEPTLPQPSPSPGLGGLIALARGVERPLPLREVRVRSRIVGNLCRVELEQRFGNELDQPMEAIHLFPLPEDAAVVEAELICGDLTVRAECRERKEAEQVFATARSQGHRAALLSRERDDIHTLRVTNLPPGQEVRVRLVIVQSLEIADGRILWRFPTTIAPRFNPGTPVGHSGPGVSPDTDLVPDASRLQPPLRLSGGTRLDLEVDIEGPVRGVASSLHAVSLELEDGSVRVAPAGRATLDRDFILSIRSADDALTRAVAWTDGMYTAVLVQPPAATLPAPVPRDAVFVIDISGSMDGGKMEAAAKALLTALHGLMPGDRFRVIAFDDRVERFRADWSPYDDRSLAAADAWVGKLRARGGTVMVPPLRAAFEGETPEGRLRTVLLITDGQAGDEQQLAALVANQKSDRVRLFTLGIDTAVNAALLQRLARMGGGTCELTTPRGDIEGVVAKLEARFGSPIATEMRVSGLIAARPEAAVVFSGRPAELICQGASDPVEVSWRDAGGVNTQRLNPRRTSMNLGPLWARERVAWLEDRLLTRPFEEEAILPEIRRIGLDHHIATRATSFVAVERTLVVGDGAPVERVQPHELPADWSDSFLQEEGVSRRSSGAGAAPGGIPVPMAAPAPARFSAMMDYMPMEAPSMLDEDAELPPPAAKAAPVMSSLSRMAQKAKKMSGWFGGEKEEAREEAKEMSRGRAASAPKDRPEDVASELARLQGADGSFGGDPLRTAAALLALVLLGHTRRSGVRQRVVLKAAQWLDAHKSTPQVALALAALERAEAGEAPRGDWSPLFGAGREGELLAAI